jgi:hypothetical protein
MKTFPLLPALAFALAACSSGGPGGTTSGVCRSANQSCQSQGDCCVGYSCLSDLCVYTNANNGGNGGNGNGGSSTGAGNGASTGGNHGSSTGGCFICGGSSTAGGSTGGFTNGGSSSGGGSSTGAPPVTYCDGLGASDGSGDTVYLQYYDFTTELTTEGCAGTVAGWADGTALSAVGGIYAIDSDDNDAATPAPALYLGTCSDVALPGSPSPALAYTAPASGFTTVAQAVSSEVGTGFWGVVTAVKPWVAGSKSGLLFVQDPVASGGTPAPGSGIEVYLPEGGTAAVNMAYGTVPSLGSVVTITNATWSPYKGANQLSASATTVVSVIGTSPLPPAVPLSAAQVSATSTVSPANYEDMRVTVTGASFTAQGTSASGDCPADVSDTVTSG